MPWVLPWNIVVSTTIVDLKLTCQKFNVLNEQFKGT